MRKPQFNCNVIGLAFILIGGIFILLNMSFKMWMILVGLIFISVGIYLMKWK